MSGLERHEPFVRRGRIGDVLTRQYVRSRDDDHRQTERARSGDFAVRGLTAGVLRYDDVNRAIFQQTPFVVLFERTALKDEFRLRRQHRRCRRINRTDHVGVVWSRLERCQLQTSDGKKDPLRLRSERRNRCIDVFHLSPSIIALRFPWRPNNRQQGQSELVRRGRSVGRYLDRKRMRRIDNRFHFLSNQPLNEPFHASEPANAVGDGWSSRRSGAARKRYGRHEATIARKKLREFGRLCRAAENEYAHDRL